MEDYRPLKAVTGQIAEPGALDAARTERLRHEALTARGPWKAEYGDYQSGGWWTTSLMNASGGAGDVKIGDCTARPTELLQQMPATAELLAELGLSYMWVRLARLEANETSWNGFGLPSSAVGAGLRICPRHLSDENTAALGKAA